MGGGTSAWLAAAMLVHNHPNLKITIVDKEVGTPVGVGEGTLLSFDKIMDRCGFLIDEWFCELDATAKAGILFPGWGGDQYPDVWHPFIFNEFFLNGNSSTVFNCWSKHQDYDFNKYANAFYNESIEKI